MNVLVVAPDVNLPWAEDEARYIVNTLSAKLVGGDVSIRSILDVAANNDFDVIWFATHGSEKGIDIGSDIIGADIVGQIARRANAKLIFLNACSSEQIAEQIYAATQIPIVCTIAPTLDYAAYFTGRNFASDLAKGRSFAQAFVRSKTKNFRMIPDGNEENSASLLSVRALTERNRDQIWEIVRKLETMSRNIDELRIDNHARELDREEDRRRSNMLFYALNILIVLIILLFVLNLYDFFATQSILRDAGLI